MSTATLNETTSPTVLFDGAAYLGYFNLEEGIGMLEALGHADEIADADTSAVVIALDSLGWSILEDTDGGPLVAGLTEHGHPLYAMTVATAGTGPSKNDLHRDSLAREVGAWKALARRAGASVFF